MNKALSPRTPKILGYTLDDLEEIRQREREENIDKINGQKSFSETIERIVKEVAIRQK